MACRAIRKSVDATADVGRNTVRKHQIQPECREGAGWRGTGRTNTSRDAKFPGASGDRDNAIFPVQLTTCDGKICNLTRLIYTLPHVMATQKTPNPVIDLTSFVCYPAYCLLYRYIARVQTCKLSGKLIWC